MSGDCCKEVRLDGVEVQENGIIRDLNEYHDIAYMRLPVDAEGVYIRVGDIVEDCGDGEEMRVIAVEPDGYAAARTHGPSKGQIWTFAAVNCRHVE